MKSDGFLNSFDGKGPYINGNLMVFASNRNGGIVGFGTTLKYFESVSADLL